MVSFQCHGCGDVVKKPKLDQHRTRCHSGYDCIDCSKTFNSPAEYKGHTSCISEAEKYEKSLYKGPKTGAPQAKSKQGHASTKQKHTTLPSSTPTVEEPATAASERQSNAQWGAKSVGPSTAAASGPTLPYGGGGSGGYGRYGGWSQQRNKVTGANDTPLGTPPPRASPVNVAPPRTVAPSKSNGHAQAQTQTQKDNKRKSGAADDAVNEDAKSNKKVKLPKEKETTVDPVSIPLPSSPGPSADDGKKKHKKDKDAEKEEKRLRKKEKKEKAQKLEDVEMAAPSGEEEKKKKSKKDKKEKGKEEAPVTDLPGEEKADKKKKKKEAVEELTPQTNGVEVNGKDKKRKRSEEDDAADVDGGEEKKKKKKEKKEKKKEATSEGAMDVDAPATVESTKKEKKNKKEKKEKNKVFESIPVAVAVS